MALIIEVKVVPRSAKRRIVYKGGGLTCHVKSAPERGKANAELIAYIAKELNLTKRDIQILTGHTARTKRLRIDKPLTFAMLLERLGLAEQQSLF